MPYDPFQNIHVAQGGGQSFAQQGARAVAMNLGRPHREEPQLVEVTTFPSQSGGGAPSIGLPTGTGGTPTLTTPGARPADVLKVAAELANEDRPDTLREPSPPPIIVVPTVADGIGAPQGSGIPEYNVSTPYGSGPGLNPDDVAPVSRDSSGRAQLNIKTPPGPTRSSALPWLLGLGLLALFLD
jgi:hypothetical protein